MYCDIGNFMISTITNNHDTLTKLVDFITYVSKYFSSLINYMIKWTNFVNFSVNIDKYL